MRTTHRAIVLFLCLSAPALRAEIVHFTTVLDGEAANACAGTDSPATGTGRFSLDTETGRLTYRIEYAADQLLGPETVAHIHGPAPACVNAPPTVDLPPGEPKIGEATLTLDQMRDMLAGLYYVNVHTEVNRGGEIRGQIIPESEPLPATTPWGDAALAGLLVVAGLFALSRLR